MQNYVYMLLYVLALNRSCINHQNIKEEFSKLGIDKITEQTMLDNYFCSNKYWGEIHRDMYNNEWLIIE